MAFHSRNKIVTDGLVFNIDAYNTKSYVSGSTSASDLTVNGNNGTLVNGVGFDVNAWTFDGVNDHLDTDSFVDMYTLEVSFYTPSVIDSSTAPNGRRVILGFQQSGYGNDAVTIGAWTTGADDETLGLFHDGLSAERKMTYIKDVVQVGWHTLTFSWNGSKYDIYLDGVQKTTYQGEFDVGMPDDAPLFTTSIYDRMWLGRTTNNTYHYGEDGGKISSVRIYNRGITASEVKQNYNATKWRVQ